MWHSRIYIRKRIMFRRYVFLLVGMLSVGMLTWLLIPVEQKEKAKRAVAKRVQKASLEAAKALFKRFLKRTVRSYLG